MTGDQLAATVSGVLCLTLVGVSLLARRLPVARLAKLAAAWVVIIVGLVLILRLSGGFT